MKYLFLCVLSLVLAGCADMGAKKTAVKPVEEPAPIVYAAKPTPNLFAPWVMQRDQDVFDARALEAAVRGQRLPIGTDIIRRAEKNDEGRSLSVDIWQGSNIGLPPPMLKSRAQALQQSVVLAGEFSANRPAPARLIVSVSDADMPLVRKWIDAGQSRARGKFPIELQWKPLKKGDLPFMRIEPADPQYAYGPYSR